MDYRVTNHPLSLESETEILRFRFSEACPNPQVSMNGGFAVEPTFGDGVIQIPAEMLSVIYFRISDLVDSFEPLL